MQLEHGQKKTGVKLEHKWKSRGQASLFVRKFTKFCQTTVSTSQYFAASKQRDIQRNPSRKFRNNKEQVIGEDIRKRLYCKTAAIAATKCEKKREKRKKKNISIVLRNKAGHERKHNRKE